MGLSQSRPRAERAKGSANRSSVSPSTRATGRIPWNRDNARGGKSEEATVEGGGNINSWVFTRRSRPMKARDAVIERLGIHQRGSGVYHPRRLPQRHRPGVQSGVHDGVSFPPQPPLRSAFLRRAASARRATRRLGSERDPGSRGSSSATNRGRVASETRAATGGMKHGNAGEDGSPAMGPIPKRRRTAEKSVPRSAAAKPKKKDAPAGEDDINSLFWLVEVRARTSRRPLSPPRPTAAIGLVGLAARVFFFRPEARRAGGGALIARAARRAPRAVPGSTRARAKPANAEASETRRVAARPRAARPARVEDPPASFFGSTPMIGARGQARWARNCPSRAARVAGDSPPRARAISPETAAGRGLAPSIAPRARPGPPAVDTRARDPRRALISTPRSPAPRRGAVAEATRNA